MPLEIIGTGTDWRTAMIFDLLISAIRVPAELNKTIRRGHDKMTPLFLH